MMMEFQMIKRMKNMQGLYQNAMNYRLGVFLVLCLILGGTSQDIVTPKLPLYLISLIFIAWSLIKLNRDSRLWKLKALVIFACVFILLNILYLIPLPPSLWTGLPGRDVIRVGYEALGMDLPWLPLSLTPEKTLFSMFDILPPLAMLLIIGVLASMRELRIAILIIVGFAVFTVLIGLFQISGISEYLYFYDFTNNTVAVGFFSNANHQASFLLMVLPFSLGSSVMLSRTPRTNTGNSNIAFGLGAMALVIILIGIILTGSVAGYLLAVPTLLGSLFLCTSQPKEKNKFLMGAAITLVMGMALDFLFLGQYLNEFLSEFKDVGASTRPGVYSTTLEASRVYFPFGTGMGSFANVYKLYEQAGRSTMPHSHNDYIEILLEFGMAGILMGGISLLWLSVHIWQSVKSSCLSMVATRCANLSILTVLIHSMADYPLRTIGLNVFFVFCACLLVLGKDLFSVKEKYKNRPHILQLSKI